MIDLYTFNTPNGRKIPILLEELGVPYRTHVVHLGEDGQFAPAFLRISPNNKIPAIVDDEAEGGPLSLFESAAILTYLADRHGRFLARGSHARWRAIEWLTWQVANLGPTFGQLGFFAVRSAEKAPLAIHRFTEESARLLKVMDQRLAEQPYLAGEYSIADMACYPWVQAATSYLEQPLADAWADKTAVHRWLAAVAARPAVQRAMALPLG